MHRIIMVAIALTFSSALGRDPDGKYEKADPVMAAWFKSLKSQTGEACCGMSDGWALQDTDWRTKDGRYQVFLADEWVDVPDNAVISEPNRYRKTVVWAHYGNGHAEVRCFLPGSMG